MTVTLTQSDMILAHLRDKGSITPLQALRLYGSLRAGARIYDLRRKGHQIVTAFVPVGRDGRKHVAEYRLVRPAGKAA